MDGFVATAESHARGCGPNNTTGVCDPSMPPDVMGYHDAREIPNYWTYAQNFVLQDRMFRAAGPHVRAQHLLEFAGPSVHRLGVVRSMYPPGKSIQLQKRQ
jgi:phospholipase C